MESFINKWIHANDAFVDLAVIKILGAKVIAIKGSRRGVDLSVPATDTELSTKKQRACAIN